MVPDDNNGCIILNNIDIAWNYDDVDVCLVPLICINMDIKVFSFRCLSTLRHTLLQEHK